MKTFPLDQTLQDSLNQMTAEGWLLIPGVIPVGIYHVVRMKGAQVAAPMAGAAPVAKIAIDEFKVFVLRDGMFIDKDGNKVDPATVN